MQLILCLNLMAAYPENADSNKCDWTTLCINETKSFGEIVRSNLAMGFWITEVAGSDEKTLIQFHDSGRMDWVTSAHETGTKYEKGQWQLIFSDGYPVLILKNENTVTEAYFKLERTCNGLVLINQMTENKLNLTYQSEDNMADAIKAAKIGLAGNWNNATYPFDIAKKKNTIGTRKAMSGAFLKIVFQNDGTYLKKYGNEQSRMIEKGHWEISRDGQFLFMYNDNGRSVAKIQHLDLDEMVLEWQLESEDTDFSTTQKSFAFIR